MLRYISLLGAGILLILIGIFYPTNTRVPITLVDSKWVPEGVIEDGFNEFDKFKFRTKNTMFYFNAPNDTIRAEGVNFLFSHGGGLVKVDGVADMTSLAKAFGYSSEKKLRAAFKRELGKYEIQDMLRLAGHIRVLNYIKSSKVGWAIVFEDLVSPILVPFWDISLDETIESIVQHANGEGRFVQLGYDFFGEKDLYSAMETWRLDPFTRTVTCPQCKGTVAYLVNQKGVQRILESLSTPNAIAACGPLVEYHDSTCDPGVLLVSASEKYHYIRTPPLFTYRYIDAPERNWLNQFQHVADAMQWAAIGEELYNTNMDGFPDYYPYTRWKVNKC